MSILYPSLSSRDLIREESRFFRKIIYLPWLFVFMITAISFIGIMMMYSAANGSMTPWANKQLLHLAIAFPLMIIISTVNIRFYYNIAYIVYFGSLILLIYVELFGHRAMGAVRWIDLGYFKLQPSDVMKPAMVMALARYYHNLSFQNIPKIRYLIVPLIMIFIPIVLIAKQPDLGTAVILLLLSAAILFLEGIRIWKFALAAILSLASIPIAWKFMHDYQKSRVIIFLNPEADPLGAGYNIMQSKIAIGSSGLFGKGLLKGSQSQLSFLPERHTDFIFTMFAEEFGFAGSIGLIGLYCLVTAYGLKIALNSKNHFGRILSVGCILLFFIHMVVNIAMVMGLLPVVGAPLPLLSYGGTIMITMYICFGMIISVHLHKKTTINKGITSFI